MAGKASYANTKDPEAQGGTDRISNTAKSDESSGNDELVTVEKGFERDQLHGDLTPEEAHRALRKCDYRLVPLLGVLYLVAFIDRSNIGNARIAGMEEDLNLQGMQYNIAVSRPGSKPGVSHSAACDQFLLPSTQMWMSADAAIYHSGNDVLRELRVSLHLRYEASWRRLYAYQC